MSGCGKTIVSRKGRDPSGLASSVVNWMCGSMLLICSRNSSFLVDFVQQVRGIKLQPRECVTSYDVSALFTSVHRESAITIIRNKLELDPELHNRTTMKVEHITSLLELSEDHLLPVSRQIL